MQEEQTIIQLHALREQVLFSISIKLI